MKLLFPMLLAHIWLLGLAGEGSGRDWPMYRKDARRSACTDERLEFPLRKAWTYRCQQAARPAWPPQPKLLHRVDYDYAAQLAVAADIVCFGSSADDTVRALDVNSGRQRWRFTADGPVRHVPQIHRGKVYFAADDGWVYCLDAESGQPVWSFQAAPRSDRLIGNGRMISRWPCRTGVLVAGDTLYATAGLFPSDGIYVYAINADTGEVRWRNDTTGFLSQHFVDSITGGHQGEFAFGGLCPEGALLLDDGVLLVPQGHANPIRLDARTGAVPGLQHQMVAAREYAAQLVQRHLADGHPEPDRDLVERTTRTLAGRSGGLPGSGGTWITMDRGKYYVLAMHRSRHTYLNAWDTQTGRCEGLIHSYKVLPQLSKDGLFRSVLPGRVSVVVSDGRIYAQNAFDLIRAENTWLVGNSDSVSAVDTASGKEVWRGEVGGEARGLAVAHGRLFVSTGTGEITCFASVAGGSEAPAADHNAAAHQERIALEEVTAGEQPAIERIQSAGMDRGYALVLGDHTGRLSRALVRHTALHVIVGIDQHARVVALRNKLLEETTLYGSRIHVHWLRDPSCLPFAQFFANAVVLAAPVATSPAELYRMLRPCGGILLAPGLEHEAAVALLKQTGSSEQELHLETTLPAMVRGPLPGANDFDNRVPDPLVKWPLELLWYGGPEPSLLADDRSGEHFAQPPVAAYGRYFVQGETTVTAVDAYNGNVLWTAPAPQLWPEIRVVCGHTRMVENVGPPALPVDKHWRVKLSRRLAATREHVFLHLGDDYFRGRGPGVMQLDARSGRPLQMFGPHIGGPHLSLESPPTWLFQFPGGQDTRATSDKADAPPRPDNLDELTHAYHAAMRVEGEQHAATRLPPESGLLTLNREAESLVVRLVTREQVLTGFDGWDLFFDFRPLPQRYGMYDRSTFGVRVTSAPGEGPPAGWEPLSGSPCAAIQVERRLTDVGTEAVLRLPIAEIESLSGARPSSFGFAATYCSDDGQEGLELPLRQRHLFGDARAQGANIGWANIWCGEIPQDGERHEPAVLGGPYSERPQAWNAPGALIATGIEPSVREADRVHPLTGESGPKVFRSGTWSCGAPSYSATCVFRRSSKPGLGIYDFADDSGLRFFGGVSAPCGSNSVAALGLFLFSDARFRCDCNPPIKTSLALAPAPRRYNEDWAIFFDRQADTRVRRATINFGAFGDRRDGGGSLWLAFPRDFERGYGYPLRPATRGVLQTRNGIYLRHVPAGLPVPMELDYDKSLGPYRMNSDQVAVENTDRPWLYASGVEGIRRATIHLDFLTPLASNRAPSAIDVNGVLNEPAWLGEPQIRLPHTGTEVFLRHDDACLYVAARRGAMVDRRGTPIGWSRSTQGRDAEVWKDDSLEVFFSDSRQQTVLHFGVSASGAVFDARAAGEAVDDRTWTIDWQSGVSADEEALVVEAAFPLKALQEAGLELDALRWNVMINQSDTRGDAEKYPGGEGRNWQLKNPTNEAMSYLGIHGRERCTQFAPLGLGKVPPYPQRSFTLRLHFAELQQVTRGQRVFHVRSQGKTVLEDFDVVKEAGGIRKAIVRELRDVSASDRLVLEFIADREGQPERPPAPPMISALELIQQSAVSRGGN